MNEVYILAGFFLFVMLGVTLAGGMLIGATLFGGTKSINNIGRGYTKYKEILQLIENGNVANQEDLRRALARHGQQVT